jgi:hypothetical protein
MAKYSDAIQWIADNDDTDLGEPEDGIFIVSICLVADLFGKDQHIVYADVRRRRRIDSARFKQQQQREYDEEDRMLTGSSV